jgi:hypothetical protein
VCLCVAESFNNAGLIRKPAGGGVGVGKDVFFVCLSRCSVRDVTLCPKRFVLVYDLATPFILICALVIIQRYTSSVRSTCRHYLGVIFKMEGRRW